MGKGEAMSSKNEKTPSHGLRLILLRHAKSAWPEGIEDKARPLSDRGRKAASAIGAYMEAQGLTPALVLVSTAERTQQTWMLVRKTLSGKPEIRNVNEIYEAPAATLLSVIRGVEPQYRSVAMIGHNPGMEELAAMLTGSGDAEACRRMAEKYPTGGLAVIDFDAEAWPMLRAGSGRLERFVTPRFLEHSRR